MNPQFEIAQLRRDNRRLRAIAISQAGALFTAFIGIFFFYGWEAVVATWTVMLAVLLLLKESKY